MSSEKGVRVLRLEIPIESDEEFAALKAALVDARASEITKPWVLSQVRRRRERRSLGAVTDEREATTDGADQPNTRGDMLDRLLNALEGAPQDQTE